MSDLTLRAILLGEDRSAGKALKGVAKEADTTSGVLSKLSGRFSNMLGGDAGELLGKVSEGFEAAGQSSSKLSGKLMGIGVVSAGAGLAMQKMASGDVAAHQQLLAAVSATGKGYEGFGEDVDKLIAKQVKFGHTDGEVQDSLRVLTQAYGDPKKAVEAMGLATDLAAAKHISLADAAAMVGKAHNGAAKVFKEFGVVVKTNKDGTKNYDGALTSLSGKLKGQASAASDTFTGKLKAAKTWAENAASSLSEKYGPAVTAAGGVLTMVAAVLDIVKARQAAAAVATNLETAATLRQSLASKLAAAGQWLWNAAMSANPIGLVIAAVALLVGGIIWAYKNVGWFRAAVDTAFHAIAAVATWLWNNALAPMVRFILNGFAAVAGSIGHVLQALGRIPGFGWAKTAGDMMLNAAGAASRLASNINSIPSKKTANIVTHLITQHVDVYTKIAANQGSNVRGTIGANLYASGTKNAARGLAIVGEAGPELLWMNGGEQVTNAGDTARLMSSGGGSSLGSGGGSTTTAPLILQLDGRTVWQSLLKVRANNGNVSLGLG